MEGNTIQHHERIPLSQNLTGQGFILASLALMALGAVMVFSTAGADGSAAGWYNRREGRQVLFAGLAAVILLLAWRVDYHWLIRKPWPNSRLLGWAPTPLVMALIVCVLAAGAVLVLGSKIRGFRRAIYVGPVSIQPAEMLKFAVLACLAAFLSRTGGNVRSFWRTFVPAAALIGASAGLVVTQDFDTAALIGIAAAALLLMAGVPWHYLLTLAAPAAGAFWYLVMQQPYRWARIEAMLNPFGINSPSTYQPQQSMIAIAAGVEPAGLGGGVAKYGYLPEDSTDSIFSIICTELGLAGAVLIVGLVLVCVYLSYRAATRASDRFGALLAGGFGFLICLQAALHIAVAVGWAPPTGTGLPFVSAGGSSLLAMAAAVAVIVSVSARRAPTPPPEAAVPGYPFRH